MEFDLEKRRKLMTIVVLVQWFYSYLRYKRGARTITDPGT